MIEDGLIEEISETVSDLVYLRGYLVANEADDYAKQIIALVRRSDRQRLKDAIENMSFGVGNTDYMYGAKVHAIESLKTIDSILGGE